jgi:leader peptidase (prepilin peptidase)/N-methyltransferase
MPTAADLLVLALLLAVASFLSTFARRYRARPAADLAGDLALVRGRSRCDGCGRRLRPAELVPLLAALVRRGRCGCGRTTIPRAHLVAEGATAAGWWALTAAGVPAPVVATTGLVLLVLATLAWLDLAVLELPDLPVVAAVPAVAAWLWTATAVDGRALALRLAATAALVAALWALGRLVARRRGEPALGGGDLKLVAAVGPALAPADLPLWAGLAAAATAAVGLARGRARAALPFGAGLALTAAGFVLLATLAR